MKIACRSYSKSQLLFLLGQIITGIGDQFYNIAVAILVYQKTSSSFQLALIFTTSYAGALLGYFIAPYLKKRFHHVYVMKTTDLISTPLVCAIPFIPISITWLFIFILGTLRGVNRPFSLGLVPKIVNDPEEIKKLNADLMLGSTLSMLGGFILGGLFIASDKLSMILILDGISFIFSSWMTSKIELKSENKNIIITKDNSSKSYLKILFLIPRILKEDLVLFCLLIPNSLAYGLNIAFYNQLVSLVNSYTSNQVFYVMTEILIALGVMISAYVMRKRILFFQFNNIQIWMISGFLTGCSYLGSVVISSLFYLGLFLTISGFFDGLSLIAQVNALHHKVEHEYMEQLFSFRFLLRNFSKAILSPVIGFFIQFYGLKSTLATVSILISIVILSCYFLLRYQKEFYVLEQNE